MTAAPEATLEPLRLVFERVLAEPTPDDLWELQKLLLVRGGDVAARARAVARSFHECLRTLESKSGSRNASRVGAVLGTAAVASVSLPDLLRRQDLAIEELLESALPAVLEIGSAIGVNHAWEVEAQLIYDEFAWVLYEELWMVSTVVVPELSSEERRSRIDQVLDPLIDPAVPDADRGALLVDVFRSVLAARMLAVID